MLTEHDNYYLKQEEPYKSCLLALKQIILALDEDITPEWKYGLPFFYYKKKMFCYFWKDKKTQEPYIGIVKGNELDHPLLESGNRKRMKILRVNPNKDIDIKTVQEILIQAMNLYKA
ncbi:MAG: DUF1801 domain-containing protein [Flavobacteriales bacterium]|nr:DUF1801 domain-containing protein [Flavobacteriales bacterium]